MKDLHKLQDAIEYINNHIPELAIRSIEEFVFRNTRPIVKGDLSVWTMANEFKDTSITSLCKVVHFNDIDKTAVYTNSYLLFVSPDEYEDKYAGKNININGKPMDYLYPNYKRIINEAENDEFTIVDLDRELEDLFKESMSKVKLHKLDKNHCWLKVYNTENQEDCIYLHLPEIKYVISAGIDNWHIQLKPSKKLIYKKFDDGRILVLSEMRQDRFRTFESKKYGDNLYCKTN